MIIPARPSGLATLNQIRPWLVRHPVWTLTLVMLVWLGPFLAKPFNIDDPLFIFVAHQIQSHPANPYGFNVEWGWTQFPMWKVTENPPLAGYYLALAGAMLGWSEMALHFAFLLPALAVGWGTHRLARHFCHQPLLAALAAVFTPVFLVSASTIMCDVLMLAFWVWAAALWLEGTKADDPHRLWAAALLVAAAEMTKYYGASLIPLLAAYSLANRHQFRRWGACLLIPLAVLCVYQCATQSLYGSSLLYGAADYAQFSQSLFGHPLVATSLTALTFTGGCLAVVVFCSPWLWRTRTLILIAGVAILMTAIVVSDGALLKNFRGIPVASLPLVKTQIIFWAVGGICVLILAIADFIHHRNAEALLLALWVLGTFFFAGFINWTINARSLLPMAPAVGILIGRRKEQNELSGHQARPALLTISLVASATLAFLVAQADFQLANAVRQCAREAAGQMEPAGTTWFQGHWGFQYYMQSFGASPLDLKSSPLKPGATVLIPSNNTNLLPLKPERAELREIITAPGPSWLATLCQPAGAGFYSAIWGPLPFAVGRVPPESVSVYVLRLSR